MERGWCLPLMVSWPQDYYWPEINWSCTAKPPQKCTLAMLCVHSLHSDVSFIIRSIVHCIAMQWRPLFYFVPRESKLKLVYLPTGSLAGLFFAAMTALRPFSISCVKSLTPQSQAGSANAMCFLCIPSCITQILCTHSFEWWNVLEGRILMSTSPWCCIASFLNWSDLSSFALKCPQPQLKSSHLSSSSFTHI